MLDKRFNTDPVAAPEFFFFFFFVGASRGQNTILRGGKNPKICWKWPILAIFSSYWGGKWEEEPPNGGGAKCQPCPPPLDAATAQTITRLTLWEATL